MNQKLEKYYKFYNNIFEEKNKQDKKQKISNEEILDFLDLLLDFFKNKNENIPEKKEIAALSDIETFKSETSKNKIEENFIIKKNNNENFSIDELYCKEHDLILLDNDYYDVVIPDDDNEEDIF